MYFRSDLKRQEDAVSVRMLERATMAMPESQGNVPTVEGVTMPEYLKLAATLLDLDPREMELRLRERAKDLESAIARLSAMEKAPEDLFDKVVSI
jgi:multidrug resistance efflux pump